jgi:hypothetical protein
MMTDVIGRWLAAGLVAVVAFGPTTARAQSIQAGTLEWTLAVGGGASLPDEDRRLETVTSVHLLPHVGYFVTGEIGEGALRGNFELLVEPTLIYLDASNSATVVGVAVPPRWLFAASPRVRPYLECPFVHLAFGPTGAVGSGRDAFDRRRSRTPHCPAPPAPRAFPSRLRPSGGISRNALVEYERGSRVPKSVNLGRIAQAGESSVDWLLNGRVPRAPPRKDPEWEAALRKLRAIWRDPTRRRLAIVMLAALGQRWSGTRGSGGSTGGSATLTR